MFGRKVVNNNVRMKNDHATKEGSHIVFDLSKDKLQSFKTNDILQKIQRWFEMKHLKSRYSNYLLNVIQMYFERTNAFLLSNHLDL